MTLNVGKVFHHMTLLRHCGFVFLVASTLFVMWTAGTTNAAGPTKDAVSGNGVTIVQDAELWYFGGYDEPNYAEEVSLTAEGLETGTFVWTVVQGTNLVDLRCGQTIGDTMTVINSNSIIVRSTWAYHVKKAVTIVLTHDGKEVARRSMDVYCPTVRAGSAVVDQKVAHPDCGFLVFYLLSVSDQFGRHIPAGIHVNEAFGEKHSQYDADGDGQLDPEDWASPSNPDGRPTGFIFGVDPHSIEHYQFMDRYGGPSPDPPSWTPPPVAPTHPDSKTSVWYSTQQYYGGTESPSGAGWQMRVHLIRYYRGDAVQVP